MTVLALDVLVFMSLPELHRKIGFENQIYYLWMILLSKMLADFWIIIQIISWDSFAHKPPTSLIVPSSQL